VTGGTPAADGVPEIDALRSSFAAVASSATVDHLRIAGRVVRLEFAGSALRDRVMPAFSPLTCPPSDAALVVHAWDAASTATPPPLEVPNADPSTPGAFFHVRAPGLEIAHQPGQGTLNALDDASGEAWYWAADAATVPFWERAAPMRQILHWWLAGFGVQQVHGGAIGTDTGGVLLVGRPGSGKSTTSLSALQSSLRYAGDDYVAVGVDPPTVHSLYCSGKLEADHFVRFPWLADAVDNPATMAEEKALLFATTVAPQSTTEGFPLRAILVPRVVGSGPTRIGPISRIEAFSALAPSTIIQLHTAGKDAFARMRSLVEQVPCHVLELGESIAEIPEVVREFLDEDIAA
jgi:hypothetical protein